MILPIDVVPGTNPPAFRWRQTVTTPSGIQTLNSVGRMPVSAEGAVLELVNLAKRQAKQIEELKAQIANKTSSQPPPPSPPPPTPIKKGK